MDPPTDWVMDEELGRWRIDYAGLDDFVISTFAITPPFTLSAWIKVVSVAASNFCISISNPGSNGEQWYLGTGATDKTKWSFSERYGAGGFTSKEAFGSASSTS